MTSSGSYRIERDSMGELRVPRRALWGAQTQRAVENFPVSGLRMPSSFIEALGLIKSAAAHANASLGLLDKKIASAVSKAADEVASGKHDDHFPVDVFQTGSGTSSNMNANEVIARLASQAAKGVNIHPNDHVNFGQSSNDVIPTAIQVSCSLQVKRELLPSLKSLEKTIAAKSRQLEKVVKTGRTHLMDAMPLTFGQELSGWQLQISEARQGIETSISAMQALALGGTAVGTGINAHPEFPKRVASQLKSRTKIPFRTADNYFYALSCQDPAVEFSGQMKRLAVALMKISNDLRWMNSGPLAGLGEIELQAQQPGSSIMPGKVNPVTPEAVCMAAAQVIGNDMTVTVAGQSGNFQLNVMLPVIAYNLLQSIELLSNACRLLAENSIRGFKVNKTNVEAALRRNPILVTALNNRLGYETGAAIAKQAYREGRAIIDVAVENSGLTREELELMLDPRTLTRGGIPE